MAEAPKTISKRNNAIEQARTGRGRKVLCMKSQKYKCPHRLPRQCMDVKAVGFRRKATLLAGIRAGGDDLCRLPSRLFKATSGYVGQGETA